MSSGTGEPQPISTAVACMLDMENEMGRTEVEIVENEERKKLYRMYKSSTALAVKEGLTREHYSAGLNTSHSSCRNESSHKAGNIIIDTPVEQYVRENESPQLSCSPMKWWDGIIDGKTNFLENSNNENISSNYKGGKSNFSHRVSQRPSVLISPSFGNCDSLPNEWPACNGVSPSFCRDRDKQLNRKSGRTKWNISTNIHSKPAAFHTPPKVSSDSHFLRAKKFFRGRNLQQSSIRTIPRADIGEPRSSEIDFVIIPPPALVLERLKRLILLEKLLRVELEREALEDWYILRGEFVGMGSKLVEKVLLGLSSSARDERQGICKFGIYSKTVIPSSFSYNWERAKRRQEKRFTSTKLYGLQNDTKLISHTARAPMDARTRMW
ncbi:hypothetical protein LSM04_005693 [Trypanosoma melophagium]|uniref:uncharacterized protein n=1 Tax=Trypanosoma melophagium TaxID=715481 RepID=UPI00351A838B|nr:hypothetical protein LSM04_005693 [Trypanosoma melophagium]